MKNTFHFNTLSLLTMLFFIIIPINQILLGDECIDMFNRYYKGIPVLVTGGCGFIGSHLVEKLLELGAEVTILDNCSSGKIDNIAPMHNKLTLIDGDITNFQTCLQATKDQVIIFHLGAFVSVPQSMEAPDTCNTVNVTGTYNLLEAARINQIKRFVFSSSCAVYGDSQTACTESDNPAPTSVYGFSKLMGEIYCQQYAQLFDMETVALRYFNVYGPRQNPYGSYAGVVAKFNYNMQHNVPLTIFGDGTQTRDYVPVATIVTANLLLGLYNEKYIKGKTFNIATGRSISLLELINILKEQYPSYQEETLFMPARPGDVKHVSANCSHYAQLYENALEYNS
jgi:nucleoside-diphosphate-sugar epimerase